MNLKKILTIVLIVTFYTLSSQTTKEKIAKVNAEITNNRSDIKKLKQKKEKLLLSYVREQLAKYALPKLSPDEVLIEHLALSLVYSEKHEQAKWVAHIILPEIINGTVGRTNDYREDPKIATGSATDEDYFIKYTQDGKKKQKGFGFDRGHLAASADFRWSFAAISESYFYSNMSPQLPKFNRQSLVKLEEMLREYVVKKEVPLFIITAPVLTDDLKKVEKSINEISIPNYFYKIAFDKKNEKAIAFLLPHEKLKYSLDRYVVSIDSIETLTGIDFFHKLPDKLENNIEKQTDFMQFVTGKRNIKVEPLQNLKDGKINTTEAKKNINSNKKKTVCGTVVKTHESKKSGHLFISLDQSYPNQVFTSTIWKSNFDKFTYNPVTALENKKICITGKIKEYKKIPTMYINSEKQIEFLNK